MRNMMNSVIWVSLVLMLTGTAAAESMTVTVPFDAARISVVQDGDFHRVRLEDEDARYSNAERDIGAPQLPYVPIQVLLPEGAVVTDIKSSYKEREIARNVRVAPIQPCVPIGHAPPPFVQPRRDVYRAKRPYPVEPAIYNGTAHARSLDYAVIRVYPVRYKPRAGKLYLIDEISMKIEYETKSAMRRAPNRPVSKYNGKHRKRFREMLKGLVVEEPDAVKKQSEGREKETREKKDASDSQTLFLEGKDAEGGSDVDVLIITEGSSLVTSFTALGNHRQSKSGLSFDVKTVTWIQNNYSRAKPNGGADNQSAIRRCIQDYARNHNTLYIILGGDNSVVPDRDCKVSAGGFTVNNMPTDLYYAGLDDFDELNAAYGFWEEYLDVWDKDGDGIYGEEGEGDLAPDVFIGRIPVQTAAQADRYINKLKNFENNPPSASFFKKMLMAGDTCWIKYNEDWPCDYTETCNDGYPEFDEHVPISDAEIWNRRIYRDKIKPEWQATTELGYFYDTLTSWDSSTWGDYLLSAANLSSVMNEGWYFMNMITHGNTTVWGLESGLFGTSHASGLTGRNIVIATSACLTGAFDTAEPSLSEAFLRNPAGGALAYIGCSRYGWGHYVSSLSNDYGGPSGQYTAQLYDSIFKDRTLIMGQAFARHKMYFISDSTEDSPERWLMFGINMQGDPTMNLRLADAAKPPEVRLTSPADESVFYYGQPCTVQIAASDPDGSVSKVILYRDNYSIYEDTAAPYTYSFNLPSRSGNVSLQAVAIDNEGNTGWSQTTTLKCLNPVSTTLVSPANGTTFTAPANITLRAEAAHATGSAITRVDFYNNWSTLNTDTIDPYEYTWSNVGVGTYSIKCLATAADGNAAVSEIVTVTVTEGATDTPPNVYFTSPANGATVDPDFSVAVNANDENGINRVIFYIDNQWQGADTTAPYTWDFSGLADGEHEIRALARDNNGNTANAYRTVMVDSGSSGGDNLLVDGDFGPATVYNKNSGTTYQSDADEGWHFPGSYTWDLDLAAGVCEVVSAGGARGLTQVITDNEQTKNVQQFSIRVKNAEGNSAANVLRVQVYGINGDFSMGNWNHNTPSGDATPLFDRTLSLVDNGSLWTAYSNAVTFGTVGYQYIAIRIWNENVDPSQGDVLKIDDVSLGGACDPGEPGDLMVNETVYRSGSQWQSETLADSYIEPIVVFGAPTFNGGQPTTVRVKEMSPNGFSFMVDEWDYLDGYHADETLCWFSAEAGEADYGGLTTVAGKKDSVGTGYASISFPAGAFSSPPVVFAQVVTVNESSAVCTRIRNVTAGGFQVKVQEQESGADVDGDASGSRGHTPETVHYIAIEQGASNDGSIRVGVTENVTQDWTPIAFGDAFTNPYFIAGMQTADGGNTCALRYRTLTADGAECLAEEEQSYDDEISHVGEQVGWFVMGE